MRLYTLPSAHSGAIAPLDEIEPPLAYWVEGHVLAQPDAAPGSLTVATWSGSLAGGGEPFAADVRNWSQAARNQLHDKLDRLMKVAGFKQATGRLLLRPHARHILSDWHTCARFMAQRGLAGDLRTALLADPAALLTEQMLARSAEHLERTLEQIGLLLRDPAEAHRIGGVVVCNLKRPASPAPDPGPLGVDWGAPLIACPLDDPAGLLDRAHLLRLVRAHLTGVAPVVFVGGPSRGPAQRGLVEE